MGQVKLIDNPYTKVQPDVHGIPRQVYIFPLRLLSGSPVPLPDKKIIEKQQLKEKKAKRLSDTELENRARNSKRGAGSRNVTTTTYERNAYVSEYAKRRANGICQLCKQPAPFHDKKNDPYLETHHIKWLSEGGYDTIENTVALCPNCHKKMHALNLDKDKNILKSLVKINCDY